MAQARPEEFDLYRLTPRRGEAQEQWFRAPDIRQCHRASRARGAHRVFGYWVFHALDHSRRAQRCLDSGRKQLLGFVNPTNGESFGAGG